MGPDDHGSGQTVILGQKRKADGIENTDTFVDTKKVARIEINTDTEEEDHDEGPVSQAFYSYFVFKS